MSEEEIEAPAENPAEIATEAEITEELEANEADVFEQMVDAEGDEDLVAAPVEPLPSIEVDPADAAEQLRVVHLDDEDYR